MKSMGVKAVLAVDVASPDDKEMTDYGTELSGTWVFLNRWNPWGPTLKVSFKLQFSCGWGGGGQGNCKFAHIRWNDEAMCGKQKYPQERRGSNPVHAYSRALSKPENVCLPGTQKSLRKHPKKSWWGSDRLVRGFHLKRVSGFTAVFI